ncbi:MAG: peroxiredoxin family protein [Planctomycetota bacterium]|jgi:peroxiredoxin
MGDQSRRAEIGFAAVAVIILAAAAFVGGCKKEPTPVNEPNTEHQRPREESFAQQPTTGQTQWEPPADAGESTGPAGTETEPPNTQAKPANPQAEPAKTVPEPINPPKLSLDDVIRAARTWGPAYQPWYGKMAPDFTLTDIKGKKHKLSDYRGKDVMLVFWATWCRPCIMEVPHLIALRNVVPEDKLAILAISYISAMNTNEMVESFVKQNERINYTVLPAKTSDMPAPYDTVNSIPTSFFIDPQGKIKLATSGLLSLGYMKAILEAEWSSNRRQPEIF